MLQTLSVTVPIYLVMALGFAAVRLAVLSKTDVRAIGTFVVNFALPALVFVALTQRPLDDVLDARYLVDYAVGSLAVLVAAFVWGRWRQRKQTALSALCGLGMACSNSGFVGYPIASQVVGPESAAIALALCMVVENLLVIPLALLIADTRSRCGDHWTRVLARSLADVIRKPLIVAIIVALVVQALRLPVIDPLKRTIGILAAASTAGSLFVIGGSLVGLGTKGLRRDVSAIAAGKLALHPLLVGLLVWSLPPKDPHLRTAAIVFAGMPMLGIYPILAQRYGHEGFCAAALLLTTVLSFLSINVIIWLLGWPGWGPGHAGVVS